MPRNPAMADATVIAVAKAQGHGFSKQVAIEIRIIAGLGVEGDAHQGATVKHRSRLAADPRQSNLRQVHLIHAELFDELSAKGFDISPAQLGENITTRGIDLLGLPRGTILHLGTEVLLEVTGLRNPCAQIENFRRGLLAEVLGRAPHGEIVRKTGIMTVAHAGGTVRAGDPITAILPPEPHLPLERV
jgi:MOSC domain-containing protein YiiM